MTLLDLKKTIVNKLKAKYPNIGIVAQEVEKGFNRPAFFVQMMPVNTEMLNAAHRQRLISVIIHYFTPNNTHIEAINMQDELEKLFLGPLQVGDRSLQLFNCNGEILDYTLQFGFDISYIDSLDNTELYDYQDYDTMQELILTKEV